MSIAHLVQCVIEADHVFVIGYVRLGVIGLQQVRYYTRKIIVLQEAVHRVEVQRRWWHQLKRVEKHSFVYVVTKRYQVQVYRLKS